MISASEFGGKLLAAINSKDATASLLMIQQYSEYMRDSQIGADFVTWISEPMNLTTVHQALVSELEIPPRILSIRRSTMTRVQRAVMLVKAMEIAIRRVHSV